MRRQSVWLLRFRSFLLACFRFTFAVLNECKGHKSEEEGRGDEQVVLVLVDYPTTLLNEYGCELIIIIDKRWITKWKMYSRFGELSQ